MLAVFVYGTLKPGEANYPVYCGDRVEFALPARIRGQLYDLPAGYPAAVAREGDRSWVSGFLLQFGDRGVLNDLDRLEDYRFWQPPQHNEYQRRFVPVRSLENLPLGYAWAYFMLPERVRTAGGRRVPVGIWRSAID